MVELTFVQLNFVTPGLIRFVTPGLIRFVTPGLIRGQRAPQTAARGAKWAPDQVRGDGIKSGVTGSSPG